MISAPRIQLDRSRLLGFRQIHDAQSGKLTGPRAMVGIAPGIPEPSSLAAFAAGLVVLGLFYFFKRRREVNPVPAQPASDKNPPVH